MQVLRAICRAWSVCPGARRERDRAAGDGAGAVDPSRGFAACLVILSHGTNGLMPLKDFPAWGQVPVHAITRFSSSLFVIVFGIALAAAFVPKSGAPDWLERRNRMLRRDVVGLFRYTLFTVVDGLRTSRTSAIVDTLL